MKKLISILLILFSLNIYGQCVRYNISENAIGLQTPHNWKIYAHVEVQLFSHPFNRSVNVYNTTNQIGYTWINSNRASIRTGGEINLWGYNSISNYFYYIIPVAFTIYPFDREYLGIDLQAKVNPHDLTISNNFTLIVRIK